VRLSVMVRESLLLGTPASGRSMPDLPGSFAASVAKWSPPRPAPVAGETSTRGGPFQCSRLDGSVALSDPWTATLYRGVSVLACRELVQERGPLAASRHGPVEPAGREGSSSDLCRVTRRAPPQPIHPLAPRAEDVGPPLAAEGPTASRPDPPPGPWPCGASTGTGRGGGRTLQRPTRRLPGSPTTAATASRAQAPPLNRGRRQRAERQ